MDERGADLDDVTLANLRAALGRLDAVPEAVREAALAAFTWRTVDAELAALTYDSVVDDRVLEGVRGAGGPRLVTFEGAEVSIEVEVSGEGWRRRLVGQLVPPAAGSVHVHHADDTTSTEADDLGRFLIDGVRAGPVRITYDGRSGGPGRVDTDWITL